MAAKLTRPTHKTAIQLHPVAESCAICSYCSRWPVRKLLDTASYAYPSELLLSRRVGGPRILYWHGGEENKSSCLCRDSKPGSPLHNLVTVLIELPRLLFCECNTLVMFRMRSVQRMFIVFMTEAVVFQWGNSEIYCSQDNCTILCIIFTACYGVVNQIKGLE